MTVKIVYFKRTQRDKVITVDSWTADENYYYFLKDRVEVHREKRSDVKAVKAV